LYEKEAILEYVLKKKRDYARQLKIFEASKNKEKKELEDLAKAEKLSKVQKFVEKEKSIVSAPLNSFYSQPSTSKLSNMSEGRDKKLPSFWIPSETPDNKEEQVRKPVSSVSVVFLAADTVDS